MTDAKAGDEVAFQFIHYYSYPFILKHLRIKWPKISDVDSEIIAEKALSEVWKNLLDYDDERPFLPWLLTIAERKASHYFRSKGSVFSLVEEDENKIVDKSSLSAEESYIQREVSKTVRRTLLKLKGKRRDVLIMRFFLDYDYKKIVEKLSLPSVQAARQLCYNALRECREILDSQREQKKNINSDLEIREGS